MENEDFKKLQEMKCQELFVGFVDILGYKEKINNENKISEVAVLPYLLYQYHTESKNDLTTFFFSDCMYIVGSQIEKVLELIACLYCQMLVASPKELSKDEYSNINLLRGGVTYGKVWIEESLNLIIGPAVVRAYELESNEAKYPRVLIDEECIIDRKKLCVKYDEDRKLYFDFLEFLTTSNRKPTIPKLKLIEYLRKCIENDQTEEAVKEKDEWYIRYLQRSLVTNDSLK